jgi:hypothetical protein
MSLNKVLAAGIQRLAVSQARSAMSDQSLPESTNTAKRLQDDDNLLEPTSEEGKSSDIPDTVKDTVLIKPLDEKDEIFKLRAYQDEMLAESLRQNTIIVLNTGSGKTHW